MLMMWSELRALSIQTAARRSSLDDTFLTVLEHVLKHPLDESPPLACLQR